jgi:hypothetical protein
MRRMAGQATVVTTALLALATPARAATVELRCPGMPPAVADELWVRANSALSEAGMPGAIVGVECDAAGAWLVWIDGSRAIIGQQHGIVEGVLELMQSRVLSDRNGAVQPAPWVIAPGEPTSVEVASPPEEDARSLAVTEPRPVGRGTEGGIGMSMVTQFWSGTSAMGIGPRLDISVGPPGNFALLLGEDALFGAGSNGSGVVLFDFQAGAVYGAPFKSRKGLGVVGTIGAERVSSSHDNASSGLTAWAFTGDLGLRGSVPASGVNLWLGADLLLRSNQFDSGAPDPVSIPSASFVASIGCFVPAFAQ